jgi:hypothetical protein
VTRVAYIHCKPDGTPFYVGKGAVRRARLLSGRNNWHQRVVNKYGAKSIRIGMLECSSDAAAYELEQGLIKCLRRAGVVLCNYTDGGDGGRNPIPETRERLSKAAKKRGVSEACELAKVAKKRGKPLSDEHKQKLRTAALGRVFSEEHRKNISASAKKRGMAAPMAALRRKWGGE